MKRTLFSLLILVAYASLSVQLFAQNNTIEFDGADDVVTTTLDPNLNTWTVECWVMGDNAPSTTTIEKVLDGGYNFAINWGHYDSDFRGAIEFYNDAESTPYIDNDTYVAASFGPLEAGVWYHLAATYDGEDLKAYKNGVLITNNGWPVGNPEPEARNMTIGANAANSSPFSGKIDEVRIWNDVRTEAEIRANMYQELDVASETDLAAYYKMNSTSGTTAVDSKNGYNGTLVNMANSWIPSPAFFGPKNCLYFDGSDNVGSFNTAPPYSNTAITIEAWIKTSSSIDFQDILSWGNTGNGSNVQFRTSNGKLEFGSDPTSDWQSVTSSENVNTDNWVHVAVTKNSNNVTLYVNGNEDGTGSITNTMSVNTFDIGKYWGVGNFFTGYIDEVRIWNVVRTESEIRENMCNSLSGNESGLVAYYNFDHSSGTYLADYAGADNNGTIPNSNPSWSSSQSFNTWLNTTSNNPATASNWSRGSAPTSFDNVGIYSFSGNDPSVSSTFDCNHFYLQSGASFNISDGASFINAGNIVVDGNFTINKTLTADNKWHLISVPNASETSFSFFGDYLQYWDESDGVYYQFGEVEVGLDVMKGYSFWGTHADATYSFTGTPITGDKSISITANGGGDYTGANLLGNPYPSSIDWNLVSGYGAAYYWNGTAYVAYPSNTPIPGGGTYGTGSRYIAPMQGFFIISEGAGTFTLTNDMRTHEGASSFYKSTETSLSNGILLQASNGSYNDQLLIRLFENTSADFEQEYDAWKFTTNTPGISQLWSVCPEGNLSIDVRPEQKTIQLGFSNDHAGNYSIGIKEIADINSAELEDTKLNQFHDLTQGPYEFNWNTSDSEERFILHLKATGLDDIEAQDVQVYVAHGEVYVRLDQPEDYQEIVFYDLAGRAVLEQKLSNQSLQNFDMGDFSGAMLVQLKGTKKTRTKKVVLQ